MNTRSVSAEEMLMGQAFETGAATIDGAIVLPGSGVTIKATAEELFKRIGPTRTMFMRGGVVVGIAQANGTPHIQVITPAAARSRFESHAKFVAWRAGRHENLVLKPTTIAQEMAAALLETEEAST